MDKDFKSILALLYANQPAALISLCVAVAIFLGAFSHIVASWRALTIHAASSVVIKNHPVFSSALLSHISQWHLMGRGEMGQLPKTVLALTLHGILLSSDSKQSLAIISLQDQNEKIYKIGDSLPNGAVLYDILKDNVVLKNNGQLEQLPLSRLKLTIASAQPSTWREQ